MAERIDNMTDLPAKYYKSLRVFIGIPDRKDESISLSSARMSAQF